ncbi:MAG: glutaredoxin family protein [candidate division WOR-3 bacterium]
MNLKRSSGSRTGHRVVLFALSTCGWCRRAKELLDQNDIAYDYIFVDQTTGEEREQVVKRVRELNPRGSYPTIEIDGEVVVGFDEERIRELLEL